jgi:hypothetical protein
MAFLGFGSRRFCQSSSCEFDQFVVQPHLQFCHAIELNLSQRPCHGLRMKHHTQWILTILPQCYALAAKLTLTVQKEIQVAAARAGMTADHLRAVFSVPPVTAGGTPIRHVPSPEAMGSGEE